jgi:hypothetical protein
MEPIFHAHDARFVAVDPDDGLMNAHGMVVLPSYHW